jgi:dihydroflavonol-4-reductase
LGKLERVSGQKGPRLGAPANVWLGRMGAAIDAQLAKRLGTKPRLDAQTAEMAQLFWYVNPAKAERELGFVARDPMETLAETVADLRTRGVVWPVAE